MATIHNGIHGIVSGKVGLLIYYSRQGKQLVRSKGKKSTKAPTTAQLAQQMRFGLVVSFFAGLKTLICKGYSDRAGARSGTNLCIAYHVKNAVEGTFPELNIAYHKVVFSKGKLAPAYDALVSSNGKSGISFTWRDLALPFGNSSDTAILIAYHPTRHQHIWMRTDAARACENVNLGLPETFSGDTLHCWMAFISADGKQFSPSSYLGTVIIR